MCFTSSKVSLVFAFLLWGMFATLAFSQGAMEISVSVTLDQAKLNFSDNNSYDILLLESCDYAVEIGSPMMPSRVIRVALPEGMKATGVEITDYQAVDISGEYNIMPMQPARKISEKEPAQFVDPIESIYNSSDFFPGRKADVIGQSDLAGQAFALVRIYPVQYIPALKHIVFDESIELKITGEYGYNCGDYLSLKCTAMEIDEITRTVKDMVVNPLDVKLQSSSELPFVSGVDAGDYDYVIITSTGYSSYFQSLLDWKNKKGVRATLVTTTWIYNSGGYSGDNQDKIRQFVQDAYSTWGALYFLIGGDTNIIPTQSTYNQGDNIPNDTYYADFDDDWTCEVHIGRVPARTSTDMNNFVSKVLTYEKEPPLTGYPLKALLLGFDLDDWTDGEDCKSYIDSYYIPSAWTMTNIYDSHSGDHESNANAAMNAGQNLVNHIDHCDYNYIGVGSYNHDDGWYTTEVDAFSNGDRQCIFYSLGCWANAYDEAECIAEHMMNDTNGGSVALVGNSRYGWYYSGSTIGLSFSYDRAFFNSLFVQDQYRVGNCFSDHKNDTYTNDETMQYIFTELTLMGDPEMPIWTAQPESLYVSHPAEIALGETEFVVHVEDTGGSNVSSALVCLMKDDEIYLTGYTNSSGDITFSPEPTTLGDMDVTVTKWNYLPSETQATVVNPLGELSGFVWDDETNPIEGVVISCSNPALDTVSDVSGAYTLYGFETGYYDIAYSHDAYQDTTVEDVYIEEGETTTLNISLNYYADDVGASMIISPVDTVMLDVPYTISCEIFNQGTETNSFTVYFQASVQNSSVIEFSTSASVSNMAAGAIDTITFSEEFIPASDTVYTLTVYTDLTGDMYALNDTVTSTCRCIQGVTVWYGNLDGSAITAYVGEQFNVDVYIGTSPDVWVADLHLCLGVMDDYITELLSETDGAVYSPLTDWAFAGFLAPQSDPNPEGWSSQSFWGVSRLSLLGIFSPYDEAPWFNTDEPIRILSFAMEAVDDSLLAGEIVDCLGPGLNDPQGDSNAGDTLGHDGFKIIEFYSPVNFRSPSGYCDYIPGDVNGDELTIGGDVTYLVNYFRGIGDPPPDSCWNDLAGSWLYSAADATGDCLVVGGDVTYLVNYFRGLQSEIMWCPETPPLGSSLTSNRGLQQIKHDNSGTE